MQEIELESSQRKAERNEEQGAVRDQALRCDGVKAYAQDQLDREISSRLASLQARRKETTDRKARQQREAARKAAAAYDGGGGAGGAGGAGGGGGGGGGVQPAAQPAAQPVSQAWTASHAAHVPVWPNEPPSCTGLAAAHLAAAPACLALRRHQLQASNAVNYSNMHMTVRDNYLFGGAGSTAITGAAVSIPAELSGRCRRRPCGRGHSTAGQWERRRSRHCGGAHARAVSSGVCA